MAQPKAPSPWPKTEPVVDEYGLPTAKFLVYLSQTWRQLAAGFVIVPVAIEGTNDLVLTPVLDEEGAASYGDGMAWCGRIAQNSTGAVTAQVGALTAVKVYTSRGLAQAGSGVLLAGEVYLFIYESSLDGGAGGLVLK